MTGHNHLTSNSYVAAYQAEVKADIQDARMAHNTLRATFQRFAEWVANAKASIMATRRSAAVSTGNRRFDRSSATGACEINDGLAV